MGIKYIGASFIFLCCIECVFAIDHSSFKACKDSGFCKRQRGNRADQTTYEVLEATIAIKKSRLKAVLINTITDVKWTLYVHKLVRRAFRVKINEFDPLKPRYEIPVGDTLVRPPLEENMRVERRIINKTVAYQMSGLQGEYALLYLKPFRVELYLKEKQLIMMNEKGLLTLEHQLVKTETHTESNDDPPVPKALSQELVDAWEENFKHHKDTKPYGPNSIGVDFTFPNFKNVYGIPEHADSLSLKDTTNGDPYRLYNLDVFEYELQSRMSLYGSVPLMWAVNTVSTAGVFWHNPSETFVDIKIENILQTIESASQIPTSTEEINRVETHWFSESGVLDVFFILADNPGEALQTYGGLTGTTPLPPLFALAYHQCRWNYNDQEDVLFVDDNFDKHDLPLDVIWLDIEHTNGKRYFSWDSDKFPNPDEMVEKLHGKGRKLVTVIDPHIKRDDTWPFYQQARELGLFIKTADGQTDYLGWCWPGSSSWLDFTDPKVRRWWAERFLDYVGGRRPDNTFTWNDMGEPSVFNGPELTMPKDSVHNGHWEHRDLHNLFGMQIHRASWDGHLLRSKYHERPFVLTRSFFAGSQRYGAVWTGDNGGNWDHLKMSNPMILSLSIAGITLAGADVGGFFGNPDPELLTRWYQAGAYQPFFRAHAHLDTKRREPYLLPQENMNIIREAIRQRYQLLPYWYTQFYLSEQSGAPVMAPLWFYFHEDETTLVIETKFMIGPAILVRPITDAAATFLDVYLPPGKWYLQHTWQSFVGKQVVGVRVDLHTIPVFYRGGFIIPRRERVRRSSSLARFDPFHLVVCLSENGGDARGELYLDDGHSLKYRNKQEFAHIMFHYDARESVLKVTNMNPASVIPDYLKHIKLERVTFLGLSSTPEKIVVKTPFMDQREVEYVYELTTQLLVIRKPDVFILDDWSLRLVVNKHKLEF